METERAAIIELFRNGNTTAQILKALNIPMKRRNFVYRTINRFRETGSLSDKPRSGRPVTATTREMKSAVRSRVWRNPHRSVRKMALELTDIPWIPQRARLGLLWESTADGG